MSETWQPFQAIETTELPRLGGVLRQTALASLSKARALATNKILWHPSSEDRVKGFVSDGTECCHVRHEGSQAFQTGLNAERHHQTILQGTGSFCFDVYSYSKGASQKTVANKPACRFEIMAARVLEDLSPLIDPQPRATVCYSYGILRLDKTPQILMKAAEVDVKITDPESILEFIREDQQLEAVLITILERAAESFDDSTLFLEVFKDRESQDRFPVLQIRQTNYDKSLMARIRKFRDEMGDILNECDTWVHVTTDFQSC